MGENTICFHGGRGGSVSPGSMNAYGTIEWSRYSRGPAVKLFNLSLPPEPGRERALTVMELTDPIWDVICKELESAAG